MLLRLEFAEFFNICERCDRLIDDRTDAVFNFDVNANTWKRCHYVFIKYCRIDTVLFDGEPCHVSAQFG